MLEVSQLSFSYNRRQLLSDLSFRVEPGSCMVVVGPNGSGKSTLLSLLSGALKPRSGTIHLDGRVGLVPQGNGIFMGIFSKIYQKSIEFLNPRFQLIQVHILPRGDSKIFTLLSFIIHTPFIITMY